MDLYRAKTYLDDVKDSWSVYVVPHNHIRESVGEDYYSEVKQIFRPEFISDLIDTVLELQERQREQE